MLDKRHQIQPHEPASSQVVTSSTVSQAHGGWNESSFQGLILAFAIAENMVFDIDDAARFSSGLSVDWNRVNQIAAQNATDVNIRATSVFDTAAQLSGGNQQKLVVARGRSREIALIIAAQPTRGLDVGSIE